MDMFFGKLGRLTVNFSCKSNESGYASMLEAMSASDPSKKSLSPGAVARRKRACKGLNVSKAARPARSKALLEYTGEDKKNCIFFFHLVNFRGFVWHQGDFLPGATKIDSEGKSPSATHLQIGFCRIPSRFGCRWLLPRSSRPKSEKNGEMMRQQRGTLAARLATSLRRCTSFRCSLAKWTWTKTLQTRNLASH